MIVMNKCQNVEEFYEKYANKKLVIAEDAEDCSRPNIHVYWIVTDRGIDDSVYFTQYQNDKSVYSGYCSFKSFSSCGVLGENSNNTTSFDKCCSNPNIVENWVGNPNNKFKVCRNCKKEVV
jgi:hypothetical protein